MDMAWDVTIAEATEIQKRLRGEVRLTPLAREPQTIAGADISYNRYSDDFFACVVLLSLPQLEVIEVARARGIATFPYRAGYLSFREIPTLLKAFEKLSRRPDVIMCDGQGIAHPRRVGIAAHIGLTLGLPAFGCAKSLLYGMGEEPAPEAGATAPLYARDGEEVIGAFVRTKARTKPVIISPGHLITLDESVRLTLATARGYRIPEPTRRAHELVNAFRRGEN
jgi:deoxyribonuclease V